MEENQVPLHCRYHSSQPAAHHCEHCGKPICLNCVINVEGEPFCQVCWEGFTSKLKSADDERREEPSGIPWQRRGELGMPQAFIQTVRMVGLETEKFFSRLPARSPFAPPIAFALFCILLFWFPMQIFYTKVLGPPLVESLFEAERDAAGPAISAPAGETPAQMDPETERRYRAFTEFNLNQMLTMPFNYLIFNVIIASMLQQALVSLFNGRKGYSATLQIRCYTMAVQCLYLIPVIGIILTEFFTLLICARGFQVVQELKFHQAFVVASAPIFFYLAILLFLL